MDFTPPWPDVVDVLASHPVHHILEWDQLRRLVVRLRTRVPAARLELQLRADLPAAAYRGLPVDDVRILDRGTGAPLLHGTGRRAAVLFGDSAGWAADLREAGVRVLGFATPSFRVPTFDSPEAESGARDFQRTLTAASPRWTLSPGAEWPAVLPERAHVLVHQARFHLGDALWLTPLLRQLARWRSSGELTVVAPAAAGRMLQGLPYVTQVVPYPEGGGVQERQRVADTLASQHVDVALLAFARRPESSWLACLLADQGVAHRVNLEYFDPDLDPSRIADWATHEGWCFWSAMASPAMLLRALDPFCDPASLPLHQREVALPFSTVARGPASEPLAILAPGGKSSQRWPARHFAELAAWLVRDAGFTVGLEGAPDEKALLEEIAVDARRRVGPAGEYRLWAATDPLGKFFGILARARLLVANDSAPIHFAEATGTPTLYFAERQKLVHSHPARSSAWALFDPSANEVARISPEQAAAALSEMIRTGVVRQERL